MFFVVIAVLLSIIYRKDPQCCKLRSYQRPHADMVRGKHKCLLCFCVFSFLFFLNDLHVQFGSRSSLFVWIPVTEKGPGHVHSVQGPFRSVRFNLHGCGKADWNKPDMIIEFARSPQISPDATVALMEFDWISTCTVHIDAAVQQQWN